MFSLWIIEGNWSLQLSVHTNLYSQTHRTMHCACSYVLVLALPSMLCAAHPLFSLRGCVRRFGHSGGSPTEEGVYRDADAALDFILNSQDVNNKDIFVVGHSMGGAVAIDLASRRGSQVSTHIFS